MNAGALAFISYPQIDPVLLSLGPVQIHWYGVAYVVGLLAAGLVALWVNKVWDVGLTQDDIILGCLWAIIAVLIGGRLGYVLFYNLGGLLDDPLLLLRVWEGGMSFHGGMLGALVTMILFARARQFSAFSLFDVITTSVCGGLFFGRLANFRAAATCWICSGRAWGCSPE